MCKAGVAVRGRNVRIALLWGLGFCPRRSDKRLKGRGPERARLPWSGFVQLIDVGPRPVATGKEPRKADPCFSVRNDARGSVRKSGGIVHVFESLQEGRGSRRVRATGG